MKVRGVVQSGLGKAAGFTGLDWVRSQCRALLGFEPFPGTLNVKVPEADLPALAALLGRRAGELVPPDPAFCAAGVVRVRVNGLAGAVVLPAEEVRAHGGEIVEILSAYHLKTELGLADGDLVEIEPA